MHPFALLFEALTGGLIIHTSLLQIRSMAMEVPSSTDTMP
jgi:hypothetical protein